MAETCSPLRTQTENACLPNGNGCTWQTRTVQTFWCIDDKGNGYERTVCGSWNDSGQPCSPPDPTPPVFPGN